MKYSNQQNGFTAVEGILIVAIVAILAVVGWYVFQQRGETRQSQDPQTATQQQEEVPDVNNTDDLEASEKYLKETDIDQELDTSEIDNSLNE